MNRTQYRLISLISFVSATTLVACSGSETPDAGPADSGVVADTGVVADSGADSGVEADTGVEVDSGVEADAGMMSCLVEEQVDTTPDPACTGTWVATVRGLLQTGGGTPVDDGRAQVCIRTPDDVLTCLRPKATCNGGEWEVLVPEFVRCVKTMVMHSFALDLPLAESYCEPDVAGQGARVTLADPIKLYDTTPVASLPPLGDATAARTVSFIGDLDVEVTPDQMFEGYDRLGAIRLAGDVSPAPCFVGPTDNFAAMYGFTPSINIDGATGYPFTVKNTGLTEGTMVDLFVLGGLDCRLDETPDSVVEEAHWENYATVAVAADGSISGNLPCFNWFAYKAQ